MAAGGVGRLSLRRQAEPWQMIHSRCFLSPQISLGSWNKNRRPATSNKDRRRPTSTSGAALCISPLHRLQNYRSTLTTYPLILPARFRLANNSPHGNLVRRILFSLSGDDLEGGGGGLLALCVCGGLWLVARTSFSLCFSVCVFVVHVGPPPVVQNDWR